MPDSQEATIVHGDYRLGNVMMAGSAPAELVAIFDWELSTIGDPLADLGYMTVTWVEPNDPEDTMFANLNAVTRREGFLTREELIARYEARSGRSMSALNWYQALALWKAAVFMEGNYKRFQAGSSDDEYLGLFDRGVPMLAEKAREIAHS
jgi:aminoglycoside phosphotransferase (APT) family kinase protein